MWCTEFDRTDDGDGRRDPLVSKDLTSKRRGDKRLKDEKASHNSCLISVRLTPDQQLTEGYMVLKPIVHEIRIQNQVIFLDPPIEHARQTWVHQLHDWLGKCVGINVVA